MGKKVSVFLGSEENLGISVKLADPIQRDHALSLRGAEPTGYGLGKAGWVSILLIGKAPSKKLLSEFIEESYRSIAPKKLLAELDSRLSSTD